MSVGMAPSAASEDVQAQQWYLDSMQADHLWKVSKGKGVKVAIIGSGVNADTPSLRGQVLQGVDALVKDGLAKGSVTDTQDTTGEGTTAAELIAGTGKDGGIQGLAPDAQIIPIRVPAVKHDELPDPNYPLATAIMAAVDKGAKIIDITVGNQYVIGTQIVGDAALDYAVEHGVLMIASVGDNAKEGNKPQYPAAYRQVVGVSAVDRSGKVSPTSQYGNYVDLAAPGVDIPHWCDRTVRSYCDAGEGTSMASAVASASAALIWSAHPDWTANQVLRSLIDTAGRTWKKDIPSKYLGYGIVRPRKVLEDSGYNPGPADSDPLGKANAAGGATPSPSGSVPAPSQAPETPSGGETVAAESTSKSSDDSGTLWIGLGAVAAVVVIGGGAFAVKRARSRA
ncbi:S8 family serine peptidase [Streptomyces nodosus]